MVVSKAVSPSMSTTASNDVIRLVETVQGAKASVDKTAATVKTRDFTVRLIIVFQTSWIWQSLSMCRAFVARKCQRFLMIVFRPRTCAEKIVRRLIVRVTLRTSQ